MDHPTPILPSVGLHYGVPFEQYRAWPAVNIHSLMPLDDSPAHCRHDLDNPREASPEMEVGSASHVAVFEPARLEKEFYFGKVEYNATTKDGKAIRAQEMEEAAGRTYIRRKAGEAVDCDSVLGMAAALRGFKPTRKFLDWPGQCEVSALWKDPVTGLYCKARFDKLCPAGATPLKAPVVIELKSTGNGHAKPGRFGKEVRKRFYDAQAMYYRWGVEILTGITPCHVFLLAENVAPYVPSWGTLGDDFCQRGNTLWRAWLDQFSECSRTHLWPGYAELVNGEAPVINMNNWND